MHFYSTQNANYVANICSGESHFPSYFFGSDGPRGLVERENERFAWVLKIMTLQQRSVQLKLLTRTMYETTTFKVKNYVDKVIYLLHVELGHVDKWDSNIKCLEPYPSHGHWLDPLQMGIEHHLSAISLQLMLSFDDFTSWNYVTYHLVPVSGWEWTTFLAMYN
jgi:hypothetical protein